MAWLRIDDRVRTHPKIAEAGPDASWFWFCGICYCREHLTDGFISKKMLASLAPGVGHAAAKRHAGKLVEARLWHKTDSGDYLVHDFLDWNPSREQVLAKRAEDRARKTKGEDSTPDSTRNSDDHSERKVNGVPPDASCVGAGAPGLGLGSSGIPGGGAGGTRSGPRRYDRTHAGHEFGFCSFKCLSEEKIQEFARDLPRGLEDPENYNRVVAWAARVRDTWADRPKLEAKWWDFWAARWAERLASMVVAAAPDTAMAEAEARRRSVR